MENVRDRLFSELKNGAEKFTLEPWEFHNLQRTVKPYELDYSDNTFYGVPIEVKKHGS
jgi:hypothetical protein